MMDMLDYVTHRLIVHISRTKRLTDFVVHPEHLDRLYGPAQDKR